MAPDPVVGAGDPGGEGVGILARTPLAFRIAYRLFLGRYERLNRRLLG